MSKSLGRYRRVRPCARPSHGVVGSLVDVCGNAQALASQRNNE
jgi:hypothetical protein